MTVCLKERDTLLTRDPLGLVLYGDVSRFTTTQKKSLLQALYEEAQQYAYFRSESWASSPFGAIATPDMEEVFNNIIHGASRESTDQVLVDCVLDAMAHGASYPELETALWNIIRDHSWWSGIRKTALQVLLRDHLDNLEKSRLFLDLLNEINHGRVEDQDDSLMGILLTKLYPSKVPASYIFSYFHHPKVEHLFGGYHGFWSYVLLNNSSKEDIAILLDNMAKNVEIKNMFLHRMRFNRIVGNLVVEGLMQWGDEISDARLYQWLSVGLDKYGTSRIDSRKGGEKQKPSVSEWISERPNRYKAIILEGVRHYGDNSKEKWYVHDIYDRVYSALSPAGIGAWFLEQAALQTNEEISDEFFRRAMYFLYNHDTDREFNLDVMFEWVNKNSRFKPLFENMLVCNDVDRRIENANRKLQRDEDEETRLNNWISEFKNRRDEIRHGVASPGLYHNLAFAYYGHLIEAEGETPYERLQSMFAGDDELYQIALEGLKNTVTRTDLPTVNEIIKTNTDGKMYYIGYGVLAGIDEIYTNNRDDVENVSDDVLKVALAFNFTESTEEHGWFKLLLINRPELVSEVFTQYAVSSLKAGKNSVIGIYPLVYDDDWRQIAIHSVVHILENYPIRAKKEQISDLDYLLKAAMRYVNIDLLPLVEKKLRQGSMTVLQRIRWLTTGLVLSPDKYTQSFCEFLENNPACVQAVAGFLSDRHEQWRPEYGHLPDITIGLLIQKLGTYLSPYRAPVSGAYKETRKIDSGGLISALINILSGRTDRDAADELTRLTNLPELEKWKEALQGASYSQRKLIRDELFQQPDICQVRHTLENKGPANSADLMALTLTHLDDLAHCIRDGSTNDFKQYWNTDQNDKPTSPKVEEACRDALLSDLARQLTPLGITTTKEYQYADNKRADITILYNGAQQMNVPIEIKRSSHKDLWTALWDQLIPKYSRDPGANGYGLYVVFWFGADNVPPPPHGNKPKSAPELKQALWNMMTVEEKRMIGLCIIDCSKY